MIRKRWTRVLILVLFSLSLFQQFTLAHNDPFAGLSLPAVSEPQIENGANSGIMPLDMSMGQDWAQFTQTTTVMYAPYPNISAPTAFTFYANQHAHILGRVYDCFNIVFTTSEGKQMYGYVPVSSMNPSTYSWVQYDIFYPATCTATTQVLSGPGTTNTYYAIGEIYAGENPLMVLGQVTNQYNNVVYYYVQYQLSNGLVKRGYVDSRSGSVTITALQQTYFSESQYYIIKNVNSGKYLYWNTDNTLTQKDLSSWERRLFKVEYVDDAPKYLKILPAHDTTKALNVDTQMMTEGLPIKVVTKTHPSKGQEFYLQSAGADTSTPYTKYAILTRCTGNYRGIEVYGGSTADGANIIQSYYMGTSHQQWVFIPVAYKKAQIFYDSTCDLSVAELKEKYDSATREIFKKYKVYFDLEISDIKYSSQLTGASCPLHATSLVCSTTTCGTKEECLTKHHKSGARILNTVVDSVNDFYDCRIVGHRFCDINSYNEHWDGLIGRAKHLGKDTAVSISAAVSNNDALENVIQHELCHNLGAYDYACSSNSANCIMNYGTFTLNTWCTACEAAILDNL